MRIEKDYYERIIENLHEGLYLVNRDRVIIYWNKAAEQISGFTANEVVGKSCSDNILTHVNSEGNSLCTGMCPLAATIADEKPREAEVYMHHKDGHRIPVSVRVSTLTDREGNIIGGIELFADISNQAASELRVKELEKLALLDNLTQLANRNYIEREVQSRFEEKKRFNVPFGVIFMDIDHFKQFNDKYGHDCGDRVLTQTAGIMQNSLRTLDSVARWGGEEFLILLPGASGIEAGEVAEKLRKKIENTHCNCEQLSLKITITFGVGEYKEEDSLKQTVKRADSALYEGKAAGRNQVFIADN